MDSGNFLFRIATCHCTRQRLASFTGVRGARARFDSCRKGQAFPGAADEPGLLWLS